MTLNEHGTDRDTTNDIQDGGGILIVDDQPANLAMLSKLLGAEGYKVRAVTSGERALEAARIVLPDCVLLDVAMPGMDGYATCEAFRADAQLAVVPIIFLTAFDDTAHKVRAFQAGGRDYVSKPFQVEEVLARVSCQMRLVRLERELRMQNAVLVDANASLREVHQLKSRVTAMLVHDVRSPLTVIGCILHGPIEPDGLSDAREAYQKINRLLADMLELNRSESGQAPQERALIPMSDLVAPVIAAARHLAKDKGIELRYQSSSEAASVVGDRSKLDRVLSNLVDNAIKFTPAGGTVGVSWGIERGLGVESSLRFAVVTVTDSGPGISPEELPYIFDPYRQAPMARQQGGFGLGLSVVQRVVAEHGGRVQVRSQLGVGTEFRILLTL